MTAPRHVKVLLWGQALCLGFLAMFATLATALGSGNVSWMWLTLGSGASGLAGTALRGTQPTASDYLVIGSAVLALASLILMSSAPR